MKWLPLFLCLLAQLVNFNSSQAQTCHDIQINATSCNPIDVGTTIDTFLDFTNCDSVVTTITTLLPAVTNTINTTTCDPLAAGTIIDSFIAFNSCDSIVTTITTLLSFDSTGVMVTTCSPQNVGSFTDTFINFNGCDSLVTTVSTLSPSVVINLTAASCDPNEIGTTIDTLVNFFGCDSIVITTTTLGDPCEDGTRVTGKVYWDKNFDNVFNDDDTAFRGIALTLIPDNKTFYTDNNGNFDVATFSQGTNQLTVNPIYSQDCSGAIAYVQVVPSGSYIFQHNTPNNFQQDFIFNSPISECVDISGLIFNDENDNGIQDGNEGGLNSIQVVLDGNQYTYSDINGNYSFSVGSDEAHEITISLSNSSSNGYCSSTILTRTQTFPSNDLGYTIPVGITSSNNDFGVKVSIESTFDVGLYSLAVYNGNEAGEMFHAYMDFKSDGLITEACTLKIEHSPLVSLLQANIPSTNITSTSVEWVFQEGTVPNWYCMQMDWQIDSAAVTGEILHWEATYECPPGIDACPINNSIVRDVVIISGPLRLVDESVQLRSMQPEGIMPEVISNDEVLSYVITFQNQLATTAYNITIIDTLPNVLDPQTISKPFSSFSNYELSISDEGVLKVKMEGINLSDKEVDQLNSYGFLQFNIQLKEDIPNGTTFTNKATVLFNDIEPTVSNGVMHRIEATSILNNSFINVEASIYPNPFQYQTTFSLNEQLNFNYDLKLFDVLGKTVASYLNNTESIVMIEEHNLPKGLYFLNLYESGKGKVLGSYKLIVE